MKKKSFYGFLLVALTMVGTSTFLSCTDELADVKQDVAVIKAIVDTGVISPTSHLQEQIDSLNSLYKQLDQKQEQTKQSLSEAITLQGQALKAYADSLKKDCGDSCKKHLEEAITNIEQNLIAPMQQQINILQGQKDSLATALKAAEQTADAAYQLAIYLQNNTYTKAQVDSIHNVINLLIYQEIHKLDSTLNKAIGDVKTIADRAEEAAGRAQTAADNAQARADAAYKLAYSADSLAKINAQALEDLEPRVKALEDWTAEYQPIIAQLQVDAAHALQLALSDSTELVAAKNRIKEISDSLRTLYGSVVYKQTFDDSIKALRKSIDQVTQELVEVRNLANQANTLAAEAKDSALSALNKANANSASIETLKSNLQQLKDSLSNYYTKGEINDKLTAIENTFNNYYTKTQIDSINAALTQAYTKADSTIKAELYDSINKVKTALEEKIQALTTQVTNLRNDLNKLITSVLIQGTYNPIVGCFQLPVAGGSSTILGAFHGSYTGADTQWPADVLDGSEKLFNSSIIGSFPTEYFENGDALVENMETGEAYGGKLYLTVNPNTVDFTGVQFSLVNSQDEVSAMRLTNLKKSDEVLKFGWTRAANNGFYEAEAVADYDKLDKLKLDLNKDDLKAVAKQALSTLKSKIKGTKDTNPLNVANAYKVIEENLSGILPATGVKASWTDSEGKTHSTYSQYNIAAVVLKPLSYDFIKGKNLGKIPTINPVTFTLDFKLVAPDFRDVHIEADEIEVKVYQLKSKIDGKEVTIGIYSTESEMEAAKIQWELENPGYTAYYATQTFHSNNIGDFCHQMDSIINDVILADTKKNIDSLEQQIINQVNKNIDKVLNDINNKVVARVNKVINKVNSYLSDLNHYLQPTTLFQAQDGTWYNTSTAWYAPTKLSLKDTGVQGLLLEPTSFTAEMFAPSFRKMVAVTDVFKWDEPTVCASNGDATCKAALALANQGLGMKTILSGRQDVLFLTDSQYQGYAYEITYAGLDYSGKTAFVKSYLRVQ